MSSTTLAGTERAATGAIPVPKIILVVLALIPALSGTARGLLIPGLKLSDVLAIALAVLVLVRWRGQWRVIDGLGVTIAIYAFSYAALTIASFADRPELPTGDLVKEMLGVPQYLLLYLLAYAVGQNTRALATWFVPSLIVATVVSLIAVAQMLDLGSIRSILAWLTANPDIVDPEEWKVYRGSGLFPSWHALAMYLCIHIVLAAAYLAKGSPSARTKKFIVAGSVICGIGLLTTSTATPILIAAVGIIGFTLRGRSLRYALAMMATGILALVVTPLGAAMSERVQRQLGGNSSTLLPQTIGYRMDLWERDFIPIIRENLWTGYGPLSYRDAGLFPHMESMYIATLMSGGLVLLACLVLVLVAATARMLSVTRLSTRTSLISDSLPFASAAAYITTALILAQFLHPYLSDAGSASLLFITLGMISGMSHSHASDDDLIQDTARERSSIHGRK